MIIQFYSNMEYNNNGITTFKYCFVSVYFTPFLVGWYPVVNHIMEYSILSGCSVILSGVISSLPIASFLGNVRYIALQIIALHGVCSSDIGLGEQHYTINNKYIIIYFNIIFKIYIYRILQLIIYILNKHTNMVYKEELCFLSCVNNQTELFMS